MAFLFFFFLENGEIVLPLWTFFRVLPSARKKSDANQFLTPLNSAGKEYTNPFKYIYINFEKYSKCRIEASLGRRLIKGKSRNFGKGILKYFRDRGIERSMGVGP